VTDCKQWRSVLSTYWLPDRGQ